eukprot:4728065-Pleurochrysis_carterae.AAC.1
MQRSAQEGNHFGPSKTHGSTRQAHGAHRKIQKEEIGKGVRPRKTWRTCRIRRRSQPKKII